jgi:hypothetical protein
MSTTTAPIRNPRPKKNTRRPSDLLSAFAESYNLRITTDDAEDFITRGSAGSVCDYGDGKLLLAHFHTEGVTGQRRRLWDAIRTQAKSLGCTVTMNGDFEGCYTFEPTNPKQAAFAASSTVR